nr:hypothetical protein [Neorhizobium tomejilense]
MAYIDVNQINGVLGYGVFVYAPLTASRRQRAKHPDRLSGDDLDDWVSRRPEVPKAYLNLADPKCPRYLSSLDRLHRRRHDISNISLREFRMLAALSENSVMDYREDAPITLQEAGWMIERLNEDLKLTDPHDPRYESLGHARFLWLEVRQKLEEGDVVTVRPTERPEYI